LCRSSTTQLSAIPIPPPIRLILPSLPLIPADSAWGNWAALTGLAALAQVVGRTTTVGRLLGAPVTAMALVFVSASVGLLNAGGTAAARALQLLSLQLATPLILLGANLQSRELRRSGPLLLTFAAAASATVLACWVGWSLVAGPSLMAALPNNQDGLKIAAALLAKNIGGGVNYIAVARSLDASASAVAAGLCVDNLWALVYFPVTSALAKGRPDVDARAVAAVTSENSSSTEDGVKGEETKNGPTEIAAATATSTDNNDSNSNSNMTVQSISTVLFLSATLLWLGELIGGASGALPACTVMTVLTAGLAPNRWMQPLRPTADTLGLVALYWFFATAGAPGLLVAESVKAALLPLSAFLACLYCIHGAILVTLGLLVGPTRCRGAFLPQRLLVASSAAIGGPATAVALAATAQWPNLTVPSILVGNVGYAVATFAGLLFFRVFR